MMGFGQQQPTNNSLNLSMTGAPTGMGMGMGMGMQNNQMMGGYTAPNNNWYAQQQQPSLMGSFLGSATGMDNQYTQNGMIHLVKQRY